MKDQKFEKKNSKKRGKKYGKSGERAYTSDNCSGNSTSSSTPLDAYKSEPNDVRWYAHNEQLLKDVASFAYGYALGGKYKTLGTEGLTFIDDQNPSQSANNCSLPGVIALRLAPTVGFSDNPNSPINICARNLYTFIRAANSGAKNYDSTDLVLYLVAMDSAYSYLAWMKRLYGLMTVSNIENRYYPWAVVTAAGGVYSDLKAHMADFRAYINMFAVRIASMCIPSHMSYFRRHEWMYEGIYMDTNSAKSQTYLFAPEGFHQFALDTDGAGYCKFTSFDTFGMDGTYDAIVRYGNALLNPILNGAGEEDFNLISGDILKAYGEAGVHRAEMITENYVVLPTSDYTALGQIQNAKTISMTLGTAENDKVLDIKQNSTKNYLIAKPKTTLSLTSDDMSLCIYRGNYMVNTYNENPGPADTMEYTRLANMIGDDGYIYTVGSEICTRFYFYYFMNTSHGWDLVQSSANRNDIPLIFDPVMPVVDAGDTATALEKLAQISAFRYHPYQYTILYGTANINGVDETHVYFPSAPIGDTNVFTLVNNQNLQLLSEVALMSEFGLETYGR